MILCFIIYFHFIIYYIVSKFVCMYVYIYICIYWLIWDQHGLIEMGNESKTHGHWHCENRSCMSRHWCFPNLAQYGGDFVCQWCVVTPELWSTPHGGTQLMENWSMWTIHFTPRLMMDSHHNGRWNESFGLSKRCCAHPSKRMYRVHQFMKTCDYRVNNPA